MSEQLKATFLRTVGGYHNKLIAEKDLLMADIQRMAENNTGTSEEISELLNELACIESRIGVVRKHFGDSSNPDEGKPKTEDNS
tara:strand:+ start:636 stop:887 length:252 start_codon:yes stop_codon:yes gene_type:complete